MPLNGLGQGWLSKTPFSSKWLIFAFSCELMGNWRLNWRARQESNLWPLVPETNALSPELRAPAAIVGKINTALIFFWLI